MSQRLNVLISAYACRPHEGSEPGVGWNLVLELSKYHRIWVLTRGNNQTPIETELSKHPVSDLNFIYCEPSQVLAKLNQNLRIVHLHYYLWQLKAYWVAKKLHDEINFDIVHHVTYVRYSTPSFLAFLPPPFIWGPVGGGETTPNQFWQSFSLRGKIYEILRESARRLGEVDPFVHQTAARSSLARGTTQDTVDRLKALGASEVEVYSQLGLSTSEIATLNLKSNNHERATRFVSIGRLLHWKGFHLGLQAFAQANLPEDTEYWIIGDGPERQHLQQLAATLQIDHQVKFWSQLSREETLNKLGECLALIHPSLHESGGLVCLEAMAAGCPVICLNIGGPAIHVTEETGFKISVQTPQQVIDDLASALEQIARDPDLWQRCSQAGQERAQTQFSWESKGLAQAKLYQELLQVNSP